MKCSSSFPIAAGLPWVPLFFSFFPSVFYCFFLLLFFYIYFFILSLSFLHIRLSPVEMVVLYARGWRAIHTNSVSRLERSDTSIFQYKAVPLIFYHNSHVP